MVQNTKEDKTGNYESFVKEYENLLTAIMGYSPEQAGSNIYASKLADLVESNPGFERRYDEGIEKSYPLHTKD